MKDWKGWGVFLAALCLSLVALGAFFLFLTWSVRNAGMSASRPEESETALEQEEREAQLKRQNLAWVLIGCREAADAPGLIVAGYYDAQQGSVRAVVVPAEAVATQAGRTDTIAGHYDYEGVRGAVNAAEALLSCEILRYFRITSGGIATVSDFLGGVEYTLTQDVVMDGQRFLAGEQLLDGRRIAAFLFATEEQGVPDTGLQAELIGNLLEEGIAGGLSGRMLQLTQLLLEDTETNLSQYDFVMRTERMEELLEAQALHTEVLALEGEYNEDQSIFTPYAASLEAAQAIFPEPEASPSPDGDGDAGITTD